VNSFVTGSYKPTFLFSKEREDITGILKDIEKSQKLFELTKVDYFKVFKTEKLTKFHFKLISGIEIYLGNKQITILELAKKNKKLFELISLLNERRIIIKEKMHESVATGGIKKLDEILSHLESIERRIAELTDEIKKDKEIFTFISEEDFDRFVKNLQ
jgi:division protein CdvB (Snf7/Vps24/ESCRT-III family)